MTEEERKAMEWLEAMGRLGYPHYEERARTLKAMLAEPRLPENALTEHITAMVKAAWAGAVDPLNDLRARADMLSAYNALRAELTKPATKIVEVVRWGATDGTTIWWAKDEQDAQESARKHGVKWGAIRLTGKATVPA